MVERLPLSCRTRRASELLLEHCAVLELEPERPPARDRLEHVLGRDLTQRLVFALTGGR